MNFCIIFTKISLKSILLDKSLLFAARIIKLNKYLTKEKHETVISNQIGRSATSVCANIAESKYGHSRADFIAKLQIALKECSESEYWLELLIESGYYSDKSVLDRCVEIKRILISSINTAKESLQK